MNDYEYQPVGKRILAHPLMEALTGITKGGIHIPESALKEWEASLGNWEPVELMKIGEKVEERYKPGMIVLIPRQRGQRPKIGEDYIIGEGEIEAICKEKTDEGSHHGREELSDLHEGGGI